MFHSTVKQNFTDSNEEKIYRILIFILFNQCIMVITEYIKRKRKCIVRKMRNNNNNIVPFF